MTNRPKPATHPIVARLRDYDNCHDGDVDEAANVIERLMTFINERVADRSTMMKGGYQARRICLEAERMIRYECEEDPPQPLAP